VPTLKISPAMEMYYTIDDYTDPWTTPETVLLLHGNSESHAAWYGWVPHLARHYRVVRPDMRGFGASTAMPRDFRWTLDILIDDYLALMKFLQIERFHLVGAKIGGTIARAFAARRPQHVLTLTVAGTPPPYTVNRSSLTEEFEKHGVAHWARRTMAARLGDAVPPGMAEYWTQFMGRASVETQIGFMQTIPHSDIRGDLPKITCPTLVITTEGNSMSPVEETRAWQPLIPNSKLLVLPGNSHHVAASDPDRCARATLEFIQSRKSCFNAKTQSSQSNSVA
jgi:3-oxoadipate enol-lactonase